MRRASWMVASALLLAAVGSALGAEAPQALSDVPQGHWAYEAVDELCARGLIEGYPAGAFEGARPATRYEMASLVVRAVRAMAQAMREQGDRLQEALAPQGAAPAPAPEPAAAAAQMVGPEDIALINKLIAEFRTELVTMGVRVDDLSRQVTDLAAALEAVDKRVGTLEAEARKHRLSGYVQVRYSHDEAKTPTSEFALRRVRINLSGPASEKTDYRVQFQLDSKVSGSGPGSKVQLREAYLTRRTCWGTVKAGQAVMPFGYELEMSPSKLAAAERALVMDQLFPNQRDIGVFASLAARGQGARFDLAVVNGSGINAADENSRKDVVARVGVPVSGGKVAVSYYDGEAGAPGAATAKRRAGLSADVTLGGTNLRAEYLQGRNLDKPVSGWYGEISRRLRGAPGTVFVKCDAYDEDGDTTGDAFRRTTFGYTHDLDAATRLTFAYERRRPEKGFSLYDTYTGDAGFAQIQVSY